MAIKKSAIKAYKRSEKLRERNLYFKRAMKFSIKTFTKAVKAGKDSSEIQDLFDRAYSSIDKAAKRNIIHKNKAAREKSKLAQMKN
ncbi:30S ribosomal protein S20 [Candidatus Absconditicoccus praedator]|uniref:30S ribosomal protein S20 n=1 Tax=Candidatus Absconditicoccus praedator TaxID=2735562 RepID=UPI001E4E58BA|nr:30S ribosomal protein S20 [Candidatus Absconditicoccus praedator]UFX83532.1 30S ribosomal protein S20 [Candidatus Absconditicoccus praedator]